MPIGSLSTLPAPSHAGQPHAPTADAAATGELVSAAHHPCHVIRLDDVPAEILLHIARYLGRRDALALSETSRGVLAALKADVVDPAHIGGTTRWVNGLSRFQSALQAILRVPKIHQRRLLKRLGGRVFRLPEHLRTVAIDQFEPHRIPFSLPTVRRPNTPADAEWKRLRKSDAAKNPDILLDSVLSFAPNEHLPLLRNWCLMFSKVPTPAVSTWLRILEATPPAARGDALAILADSPAWYEREQALQTVIGVVRQLPDTADAVLTGYADALARVVDFLPGIASHPAGQALSLYWDEIFLLASRFPLPSQQRIMSALAGALHTTGAPTDTQARDIAPLWRRLIDDVLVRFAPEDATDVLCTLAQSSEKWWKYQTWEGGMPILQALWEAARILPEACGAELLASIVASHAKHNRAVALWDSAFQASESCTPFAAAPLYRRLATAILELPEAARQRYWDTLCQRLAGVEDLLPVVPALQQLAAHPLCVLSPPRRAQLWQAAQRLPVDARAAICATMTLTYEITPALWQALVLEMADLPPGFRWVRAPSLAGILFRYGEHTGAFDDVSLKASPDAGALAVAAFPRNLEQALARLSDILAMLPLRHRGAALLTLSQITLTPPSYSEPGRVTRVVWLLEEVLKLAPLHHHGIDVVTNVATAAQRDCKTQAHFSRIFPPLCRAVAALPLDARITALSSLAAMVDDLMPGDARYRNTVVALAVGLPAADTLPEPSRKRKEPPQ